MATMSSYQRVLMIYCVGQFAYLAYALGVNIWFEHLIAEGRQDDASSLTLTLLTVYVFIVMSVFKSLTVVLQEGSVTFRCYIPAKHRNSTVAFLGNHIGFLGWTANSLWLVYRTFKAESTAGMATVLRPVFRLTGYICCIDTVIDLVRIEVFLNYVHHIAMIAFTVFIFELAPDYQLNMIFWSLQAALDRLVWLLLAASRMAYYRKLALEKLCNQKKVSAANSSEETSAASSPDTATPLSSPTNEVVIKPHASDDASGLRDDNTIDEFLLPHIDALPKWFSIAFVYYLSIRVLVCTMACVHLHKTWSESTTYWKIITICGMFIFTVVDVEAYKILYSRSRFSTAVQQKEAREPEEGGAATPTPSEEEDGSCGAQSMSTQQPCTVLVCPSEGS